MISVRINGQACDVEEEATLLSAATEYGVFIPTLCHHPDLATFRDLTPVSKSFRGEHVYEHRPVAEDVQREFECFGLCVFEVEGCDDPVRECDLAVRVGMSIHTERELIQWHLAQ